MGVGASVWDNGKCLKMETGGGPNNDMKVLNATELHTSRMVKMVTLKCIYFTTIKKSYEK